jgi:hypothetical protein
MVVIIVITIVIVDWRSMQHMECEVEVTRLR